MAPCSQVPAPRIHLRPAWRHPQNITTLGMAGVPNLRQWGGSMLIKKSQGQSLIELIIILPLLISFWAALMWFANILIVKIELLHTARHGVMWLVHQSDKNTSAREE